MHIWDVIVVDMKADPPDVVASVRLVAKNPEDAGKKASETLAKADPPILKDGGNYHAQVLHLGPLPQVGGVVTASAADLAKLPVPTNLQGIR